MKLFILLLALTTMASARCPSYKTWILTDTSHDARGLQKTVDLFRARLGGMDNMNNAGPLKKGHRSINWDAAAVPFDMPGDFFDATVTRGALFKTKTGEFRVSNPVPPPKDDRFDSIVNPFVSKMFKRFSLERLFTPLNSNRMTMTYRVPVQGDRAAVTGFGAIFTDVDKKFATNIKYFDKRGCLIARVNVPPKNRGLSFAGLIVVDPRRKRRLAVVAKVRIKFGTISMADFAKWYRWKRVDLVVADDFIYGEPQSIM